MLLMQHHKVFYNGTKLKDKKQTSSQFYNINCDRNTVYFCTKFLFRRHSQFSKNQRKHEHIFALQKAFGVL